MALPFHDHYEYNHGFVPPLLLLIVCMGLQYKRVRYLTPIVISLRLLLAMHVVNAFLSFIVLPATIVAQNINTTVGPEWETVELDTGNFTLDVSLLSRSNEGSQWMVFFNPNGVRYEQISSYLDHFSEKLGVSVAAFNYRSVGKSGGSADAAADLVVDGGNVVEYVRSRFDLKPEQLILYGWSLGGGVAVHLRKAYPGSCVIHERSFKSLSSVGQAMVTNQGEFGLFVGSALAALAGGSLFGHTYITFFGVAGAAAGYMGFLSPAIGPLMRGFHWDMDVATAWEEASCRSDPKCVVIYHKKDGMIPYTDSSLHHHIVNTLGDPQDGNFVELTKRLGNDHQHHMYPLYQDPKTFAEVVATMRKACMGL